MPLRPPVKNARARPRAKRPSTGAGGWKPVVCTAGFLVKGGFLKKSIAVETFNFQGTDFVKVNKNEQWVCLAASGKSRGKTPLVRTGLIEDLAQMLADTRGDQLDSQSSRSWDDSAGIGGLGLDDAPAVVAPKVAAKGTGGGKKGASKRKAPPLEVLRIPLPPELQAAEVEEVRCLSRCPTGRPQHSIFLDVSAVPWLISVLKAQVDTGGVAFQPRACGLRKPWWSERDRSWICRAKAPSGDLFKKSISVPIFIENGATKRPITKDELDHLKTEVKAEIEEWQSRVEDGGEP